MEKDSGIRHYGYVQPGEDEQTFHARKGQVIAGYTVGILLIDVWYPLLPGNVVNASTFDFPVRHKLIPGSVQPRVHGGDPTLLEDIIAAGRELEEEGVRAICGACGYLGNFQRPVAAALRVPVFLSSLLQMPLIRAGLCPHEKIGILCADAPALTPELLTSSGVADPSACVVVGLGDGPQFSAILRSDRGSFDQGALRREVVGAAVALVERHPDVGALLLECSDLPPYAADVQRAVSLPVFDFLTMIKWVHGAVAQRPYRGFI